MPNASLFAETLIDEKKMLPGTLTGEHLLLTA